jgi:hypothetical protein
MKNVIQHRLANIKNTFMKNIIQLIFFCLFIYSCSSNNELNEQNNIISTKLIESLSFDNETSVDSLFYDENKRLILKKEYLDMGQLDYSTNYQYNSDNNLIKIYKSHSTSNTPTEEINYTYYPDGNLKSRNHIGYNSNYTDNFEYESNTIISKKNQSNEIRLNLDSNNKILSVERKNVKMNSIHPKNIYIKIKI